MITYESLTPLHPMGGGPMRALISEVVVRHGAVTWGEEAQWLGCADAGLANMYYARKGREKAATGGQEGGKSGVHVSKQERRRKGESLRGKRRENSPSSCAKQSKGHGVSDRTGTIRLHANR